MMTFNFDNYFEWLVPWEGSVYENDPDDPGGATKYGIDQRSHPLVNIRRLTKQQAKEIYFSDYWLPVAADKLPPQTAWAVMDCAVNCGRTQAAKWLQRVLGVRDDGVIGPVTLNAAAGFGDHKLALSVLSKRRDFYIELARKPRMAKFLNGWLNRNNDLISQFDD